MVTLETYRKLASALPGAQAQVHSGMPAFAVGGKRFAIFDPRKGELALRIPLDASLRADGIVRQLLKPAPGRYGADGWVGVDLEGMGESEFRKLLRLAHECVG